MENNVEKSQKKTGLILTILVIVLTLALGLMFLQYNKLKTDNSIVQEALEDQKESLSNELKDMMSEYEGLKSENDSVNNQIDKQQDRIKKLLTINASNLDKIKLYKKELTTLREVMRSYIVQIDSLNVRNQMLVSEKQEVTNALSEARKNNEDLSKEKEDLNSKVQVASVMSAKGVNIEPLNKRGKDTDKALRTAKIKTCFTIRENPLIAAGEKMVFLRITRPDQLLLASSEQDIFTYEDKQIVFTAKRAVTYESKDVDMCIFWDNSGELIKGDYNVDLFCEGHLIGSGSFVLR